MKKWPVLCSLFLAASVLTACGNDANQKSQDQKEDAFLTEKSKDAISKADKHQTKDIIETKVTGQKMSKAEQEKLTQFISDYPVMRSEAIASGNFEPLANEAIMHDTKLYENLSNQIPKKHKQGDQEEVNKLEIVSIDRKSDTDFVVKTKEYINETKNGNKSLNAYDRTYSVYYDYVDGDENNSFFKISDLKETKF